jgi:hypothetical protein
MAERDRQQNRSRRRTWPPGVVERLGERFENGETYKEIAHSVGVSQSAIASLLWRHGYTRRDPDWL